MSAPPVTNSKAVTDFHKVILVMGNCGNGKSSLIGALEHPTWTARQYESPEVGESGDGTTKEIAAIEGKNIAGHAVMFYDSPGLGDPDVQQDKLLAQYVECFKTRGIDLILMVHAVSNSHFDQNTKFVKQLINKGLVDDKGDLWSRVILVGTKADTLGYMPKKQQEQERGKFVTKGKTKFFEHATKSCPQSVVLCSVKQGPKGLKGVIGAIGSSPCFQLQGPHCTHVLTCTSSCMTCFVIQE